jgi:hypothetical protein
MATGKSIFTGSGFMTLAFAALVALLVVVPAVNYTLNLTGLAKKTS